MATYHRCAILFAGLVSLLLPTANCWNEKIAHPVYEIPRNVLASLRSSMIDPGKYNWTVMDPQSSRAGPQLCGVPNPPSNMRIVGGTETSAHEFPWQVFLIVTFPNRPEVQCAGTLIYQDWVMTVAHCMEGASYIDVILGANNLMADEPNRVGLRSYSWIIHPDYNADTLKGDLAVIRLPVAVPYNTYMRPICLPDIGTTQTFADDTSTVSGWGKSSDVARCISPVMQKTQVDVITNTECEKYYSQQYVRPDTICSNTPGKGNCGGDSGGPLALLRDDGTYVQIGITAFISAQGCEAGPNGYTRTSTYSQWISDECPLATTLAPTTTAATTTTTTAPTTVVTQPTTLCPPIYTTLSTKACPACPTNPVTTPSVCTTPKPDKLSCLNLPNGYFVDPVDACSGNFYLCNNGLTYLMNCPAGLIFDPKTLECVGKTTIYPCNGAG